ncbi:transglutaminase family protein [Nocardioides mangrovi]|uniref:Transglutaminase family protein n=1 Tax=Nocardioides mangrovi TaxID=2874580 RepID=A0ABS7UI49_9ACTN|nr:transglutaminase family protein [Nocardioides mangrovi]MBZ5740277.1 transglutaminase family protein [Nocardioides mangrovi]
MQLRVVHRTTFEYDGKAVASYNQARLTPQTTPEQIVSHSRVEVSPAPWIYEYRDYFGTAVTAFEVLEPHDSMTVTATATVHTNRPPAGMPTISWEELADPDVMDRWTEYLALAPMTEPGEDFAARVKQIGADASLPGDAARAICELVQREVEYRVGATDVHSRAADVWEQRAGVCQDMAHLAIGGMRQLGIPARYVSGYFHPRARPEIGETVPGESHAWVEWWDHGWHAFDPTNDTEPGDRYVVVATGRDYDDVKPLSGIYSGAATSAMDVEVTVTRLG